MDRYKCRFCFKSFINGRALGGHMRSHMLSLSPKRELYEEGEEEPIQLGDDVTESEDASSSSDEDGESETESSRIVVNSTKRRSKRTRKLGSFDFEFKKLKTSELGESMAETEHQSSASDTTTEEDLAFCLIMLSRDKWKQQNKKKKKKKQTGGEEEDDDEEEGEEDYKSSKNRGGGGGGGGRGRFKCETCGKVFKSYQALGGHRASHKKNKTCSTAMVTKTEHEKTEYDNGVRVHECPICFRVFSSGQALGGHKRSHGSSNGSNMGAGRGLLLSVNRIVKEEEEVKQRMIDLNLPAPNEDDETTSVVVDEW